jgi:transcriptional regulator with XRE-family HTH domain
MPKLITETGRKRLGRIMVESRERQKVSMNYLVDQMEERFGYRMGSSTISNLERGHNDPTWNTLEYLASLEYICWPDTGAPLTAMEMMLVACELIVPERIHEPDVLESVLAQLRFYQDRAAV